MYTNVRLPTKIPFPGQGLKVGLDQNVSVAFLQGCTSRPVSHLKSRTEPKKKRRRWAIVKTHVVFG